MDVLVLKTGAFGGLLTGRPEDLGETRKLTVCHRFPGNGQSVGLRLSPRQ